MNKKLFLLGVLALLLTVSNVSFASDDGIENDDDEMHAEDNDSNDSDDNDEKGTNQFFKGQKKSLHNEMKEDAHDLRESFWNQVDTGALAQIKTLKDSYKDDFEAIRNDTTKTDAEKKTALKLLQSELDAKIKALLPIGLQDDFDTLRAGMKEVHTTWKEKREDLKQEWKNAKDERKAKREERRDNMKGKMRMGFVKLDTILDKFEAKKTPDQLITTYTNLLTKLGEKLANMDNASELTLFLQSIRNDLADKIAELKA